MCIFSSLETGSPCLFFSKPFPSGTSIPSSTLPHTYSFPCHTLSPFLSSSLSPFSSGPAFSLGCGASLFSELHRTRRTGTWARQLCASWPALHNSFWNVIKDNARGGEPQPPETHWHTDKEREGERERERERERETKGRTEICGIRHSTRASACTHTHTHTLHRYKHIFYLSLLLSLSIILAKTLPHHKHTYTYTNPHTYILTILHILYIYE